MADGGNGRVYIVDDDEPVRDSLKTLLESFSLDVRDYASCNDFIDTYDGSGSGCLLLDLHLPVMGGLEFLERYGPRLRGMPVIMISGRGDPATVARARGAGVVAFLEKPFEEETLIAAISSLLPPPAARPGT
ncbi:response regulator transcription factor [Arenibaculum sp.]|uniref:response regulator transcription factor n=1 Tax=Arenibaculum sp. TaxID=2865862 RepID=UPI002E0E64D5|nr:response regulator [Arenibaculum sp.]